MLITVDSQDKKEFFNMLTTMSSVINSSSLTVCGHNSDTYCQCMIKNIQSDELLITSQEEIKSIDAKLRNEKRHRIFGFHQNWTSKIYKKSSFMPNSNKTLRNIKTLCESLTRFRVNLKKQNISFERNDLFVIDKSTYHGISTESPFKPT